MEHNIEKLVTDYDHKRSERLAADKVAAELATQENNLKLSLILALKEANLTVAGNTQVFVTLRVKERKQVLDWQVLYEYIATHNAFDLLQRRLNEAAVTEREEEIPGITSYEYDDLSRPTKVK